MCTQCSQRHCCDSAISQYHIECVRHSQVHPDVSGTDTTMEAVQLNLAYARLIGVSSLLNCTDNLHQWQL